MPRCRSHGLTLAATAASSIAVLAVVMTGAGCQVGPTDNGCQIMRQIILPGTTPLPLLPDVRLDRAGGTTFVIGTDTTSVRWVTIAGDGTVGPEQSLALPADTIRSVNALAQVDAPGDHVIVGVLVPAANGTDAELRFISAPADGSPAAAPGDPIATFGGGVDAPPEIAMGTSATGMYAGAAWIDAANGPTYVFIDGQAQTVGAINTLEASVAPGYSCLRFSRGKDELTINYQRAPVDTLAGPDWAIADVTVDGGESALYLKVAQIGGTMGCAETVPTPDGYSIAWQDMSGSWLSVYNGTVNSYPFASATDFGGADLQPPLVGATAFGNDFGILLDRPHAVELWRVDQTGHRRAGALVLPSLQGDIAGAVSVASDRMLTTSYADLSGPGDGRRLVIDAVCY
jgi:hypothetical protein